MYTLDTSFLRPSRMDVELVQPHILNNLTSSLQVSLLLEIIKRSYMGQSYLSPVDIARELDSHPDTIRHKLKYFCQLGIVTHQYKHMYTFHHFKSMIKDTKGYIKLYDFLFSLHFRQLTLKSQRAILFILGQLAEKSIFDTRNIIIDTNLWYSRNDNRLFPLSNKQEVKEIVQDLTNYFEIDTTFFETKGSIAVKSLRGCYQKELLSTSRFEWMLYFLEEYQVYYIHPFHLNHLVKVMDSLSMNLDYSSVLEVFHNALFLMKFDKSAPAFLGSLSSVPENETKETYSQPVLYFINHYLQQSLLQFGHSIESALSQDQITASFHVDDWKIVEKLKKARSQINHFWSRKANQIAAVIRDIYLPKAMKWISAHNFSSQTEAKELTQEITKKFMIFNLFLSNDKYIESIDTGYTSIINQIRKKSIPLNYKPYNWIEKHS